MLIKNILITLRRKPFSLFCFFLTKVFFPHDESSL